MRETEIDRLTVNAENLAAQNNWGKEAMKVNTRILKLEPNNVNALTRLAKHYRQIDQNAHARKLYTKVLTIDPDNRIAKNNIKTTD